jgi:hypothetical protein
MSFTFGAPSGAASTAIGNVLTWQHTVEDGENRILIVAVSNEGNATSAPNVNFCTYNGLAMTRIATTQAATSAYVRTTFFELINPPVGNATVRATLVTDSGGMSATAVTMFGARQQTAEVLTNDFTTATGTALSGVATVITPGSVILDTFTSNLGSMPTPNVGQTQIAQSGNASTGNYTTISAKQAPTVGDYTHGYTSPAFARASLTGAVYAPADAPPSNGNGVTFVEPGSSTIYPRIGGKADIDMAGAFTGAVPDDVQLQVMNGAAVALPYKSLANLVIANGQWSGRLIGVPEGGMYRAAIRTRTAGTTLAEMTSSNFWGVGAIFALLGSSTPAKWINDGSIAAFARMGVYDGKWNASSGVGVGATTFAQAFYAATGVPVGFIDGGEGGTLLSQWRATSYSIYQRFVTYLAAVGGRIEGAIIGVGSNDARSSTIPSQASHETSYRQLIANVRASAKDAALPIIMLGSQRAPAEAASTDNQFTWARAAELNVSDDANNYMGSQNVVLPMDADRVHISDAGTAVMAKSAAAAVLFRMGLRVSGSRGPKPISATYTGTTIRVKFEVRTGTGLIAKTPSAAITGFEVSTDGFSTLINISNARVVSPTEVDLTVPDDLASPRVRYLYGHDPVVTNPVYDNGATIA